MEQTRESMDKNRIEGVSMGRAGDLLRSPYSLSMRSVDPAIARGRRLNLPREICPMSPQATGAAAGNLIVGQKSAEGIVGHGVGKAREALQYRKVEQQIGRVGNGG